MLDADVLLVDRFCEKFDLCFAIDTADATPVIVGLHEARIYCFDEAQKLLAIELCPDELEDGWSNTRTMLLRAEFDLVRDSSFEAYLAFNSQSDRQCRLAVEVGGFMPVTDSAAHRATMREVIQAARQRKAKKRAATLNTRQRKLARQGIYVDLDELEFALLGAPSQYVCNLKF